MIEETEETEVVRPSICYFCGSDEAIYPCEGHKFCPTCMATLIQMGRTTGYTLDALIAYYEPHRKEIAEQRKYWKSTMEIVEKYPEYAYHDVVYSE